MTATVVGDITTNTRTWLVTITGLAAGETSASFTGKGYTQSSFTVAGTFGSTSLQFQGSNDGGTTWANIGLAITSAAGGTITPSNVGYRLYQLVSTGGSGTSINASIAFASNNAS